MTIVLDGRETSAKIAEELKAQVEELKKRGITPTLAL
ncbi:MAG: bifunctional 5,10-methylene-tetrahydrofolate dehydrogenase/5,10-methylene-tetrahydrofolate cyclohydrolase, partial [Candidatus Bathyarchaeota archaeon]|nr:bifunctional 5,10-methylene-tetrahydrofolate dehydrogenase/5,10-methylene-tetrahydrofolate cyclohydrolase [Candidatus Bathyarchaeota archaeon]